MTGDEPYRCAGHLKHQWSGGRWRPSRHLRGRGKEVARRVTRQFDGGTPTPIHSAALAHAPRMRRNEKEQVL